MVAQLTALVIFIAVFAAGSIRKGHIGVLSLAAACGVGLSLASMSLKDIIGGFPVGIMILLAGVTFFFGIAQANGTIDQLIDRSIAKVGDRAALLPILFFVLSCGVAAMGSSLAALALAPIAMPLAKKYMIDPMLMGLAIGTGLTAGAFAPTSLFGIISYGTAREAGIDLNPLVIFAVAIVTNLVLLVAAFLMFGGTRLRRKQRTQPSPDIKTSGYSSPLQDNHPSGPGTVATSVDAPVNTKTKTARLTAVQIATIICIAGLLVSLIWLALTGGNPDVGILCFAFGAVLTLLDPATSKTAITKIDWPTILLVGGVITYVGVLEHMGAIEIIGHFAEAAGTPLLSAFALCVAAALISAFASTTGMLAAIIPLSLPLVAAGGIPGWAIITALAICSALVDLSPYSTVGATIIATAPERERARMTSRLIRWGMSMVIIGPVALVGLLVLPGTL